MAMGAASIGLLMMVSLEALLLLVAAAGTSAAAVSGGTIRLPSDARAAAGVAADLVRAMARAKHQGDEDRPWGECCDYAYCTKSIPPLCRCGDEVERCSDACLDCRQVEESRYVCDDKYLGDPGPNCHEHGNGRGGGGDDLMIDRDIELGHETMAVVRGARKKGQERPWKCCDKAVPGPTTQGTVWYCMDKVERCTCDRCYKLEDSHSYYYCLDGYQGSDPGPSCSHE